MASGQIVRSKANSILEGLVGETSGGTRVPYYIGLSTTALQVDGSGFTEPSTANGYTRRKLSDMGHVDGSGNAYSTADDGMITNTDIIFFPESLGDGWGTITHFFITKSSTVGQGTAIFYAPLNQSLSIPSGYVPIFRKEALAIGLDRQL